MEEAIYNLFWNNILSETDLNSVRQKFSKMAFSVAIMWSSFLDGAGI